MENEIDKKIIKAFNFFNKIIYNKEIKPTPYELKLLLSFKEDYLRLLGGSINNLFYFFSLQFSVFENKGIKYGEGLKLKWLLTEKSLLRWKNKNDKYWKYFLDKNFYSKYREINYNNFYLQFSVFEDKVKINFKELKEYEEFQKKRYLNSSDGLQHCINVTTLFNPISIICNKCTFNKQCKNFLKTLYPNIYEERGL